MSIEGTGDSQF